MRENALAFIVILFLLVGAFLGVLLRLSGSGDSGNVRPVPVWRVTYHVVFKKLNPGAQVRIALPDTMPAGRISRELIDYSGLNISILRNRRTRCRELVAVPVWSNGGMYLNAEFDMQVSRWDSKKHQPAARMPLETKDRAYFLRSEKAIQIDDQRLKTLADQMNADGKPQAVLIGDLFDFCSDEIALDERGGPGDALNTILSRKGNGRGKARALVALCRITRIPARLVSGFVLESRGAGAGPHVWAEVYYKKQWLAYDPQFGYAREVPAVYIPVRKDGIGILRGAEDGVLDAETRFSAELSYLPKAVGSSRPAFSDILDLSRLSMSMQETLIVIMLLVVGAVITAVFRNIIGLGTFGTFTPTLLALSFVYKDILTGLVVFGVVLTVGIGGRILLARLQLLLVPRLGVILLLVVICLVFSVSMLAYLGLTPSAHAVLLPTVIFTMLIERFHVSWEERGLRNSLKTLGGTVITVIVCLIVFKIRSLRWALLEFPELLLICGAILVFIGRYSGYRVSELFRFRNSPLIGNMQW